MVEVRSALRVTNNPLAWIVVISEERSEWKQEDLQEALASPWGCCQAWDAAEKCLDAWCIWMMGRSALGKDWS